MERWFAVFAKPRQEAVALTHLERQGYHAWLPRASVACRLRGRWSERIEPLFPRYLFLRVDPHEVDISPVRSTRGCTGFVRVAGHPVPVPDPVIEWLQQSIDPETGLHAVGRQLAARLRPGDRVRILEGPFRDVEGVLQQVRGEDRALVLLQVLNDTRRVSLPAEQLQRLDSAERKAG